MFAARLKWLPLSRSVSVCVGDPVSVQKKLRPVLMISPRPHTSLAMIVEWLRPWRRDKKEEVGRGQMKGGSLGAAFAFWSKHPTSPS